MTTKSEALEALEEVIKTKDLRKSTVGRLIAGDPNFVDRLRDPDLDVTTKTIDRVWSFVFNNRPRET